MTQKFIALALALISAVTVAAQVAVPDKEKTDEERRHKSLAFLRETMIDVSSMRTLENRVSFTAEMAALMWYHDEREARQMFGVTVNDFKALLQNYDTQMNSLGAPTSENTEYVPFLSEPSDRGRIVRKFRTAIGVRQQIALSIAEHEPELAYNFFFDSLSTITNAEFRKQMESGDRNFEQRLIAQIAQTNAAKATEFAKRSLSSGLISQHVELLKQIYDKDQDRAVEFGSAILSKIKDTKPTDIEAWPLRSLLSFAGENLEMSQNRGNRKAIYSAAEVRDIADILARGILENKPDDSSGLSHVEIIEKYLPARAAQIRAKFGPKPNGDNTRRPDLYTFRGVPAPPPPMAPTPDYRGPVSTVGTGVSKGSGEDESDAAMKEVLDLSSKQLPKEERERIIAKAREIIAKTPGRDKKIVGLSLLAVQVQKAGDEELASEIMRDAASLVGNNPKTYRDFLSLWMLASGYVDVKPEMAFNILEDAVFRANDLISSFVRIAEFIDVAEEMVVDGEVQVGAFGGNMIRGLTREIGVAEGTISKLANTDLDRTRALTNRFDRPEIRVMVKMLVLRTLLDPKKKEPKIDTESDAPGDVYIAAPVPRP